MNQDGEICRRLALNIVLRNIDTMSYINKKSAYISTIQTAINDIIYFIYTEDAICDTEIDIDEEYLKEKYNLKIVRDAEKYNMILKLSAYIEKTIEIFNERPYWIIANMLKSLEDTLLYIISYSRIGSHVSIAYIIKLILKKVYLNENSTKNMKLYALFFIIGNMKRIREMVSKTQEIDNNIRITVHTADALDNAREIMSKRSIFEIITTGTFI